MYFLVNLFRKKSVVTDTKVLPSITGEFKLIRQLLAYERTRVETALPGLAQGDRGARVGSGAGAGTADGTGVVTTAAWAGITVTVDVDEGCELMGDLMEALEQDDDEEEEGDDGDYEDGAD